MGLIIVVSSPSGCGKTTVVNKLLKRNPGWSRSISYTTRPLQKDEVSGKDYHFISNKKFKGLIDRGFFVEWAEVHGYYYGTSQTELKNLVKKRKSVFCVIDVKGGLNIKKIFPRSVLIFLLPPDLGVLKERITGRGRENARVIRKRLERMAFEFEKSKHYDYCLVNDKLAAAVKDMEDIITAEMHRTYFRTGKIDGLIKECYLKERENDKA